MDRCALEVCIRKPEQNLGMGGIWQEGKEVFMSVAT